MASRTTSLVTIAGITAVTGVLAYVIYFDYKRRNDAEFRRKLRKDQKRVEKTVAQLKEEEKAATAASSGEITPETIRATFEKLAAEPIPASLEEREVLFMKHVSAGEKLVNDGPSAQLEAAASFYQALKVYPSPLELIAIYEKTVPPPVFMLVLQFTNLDVKQRAEDYYHHFPPTSMNVSIEHKTTTDSEGNPVVRKALVAKKAFAPGDLIYKEYPIVAALDFDLHGEGTYCSKCFRPIQKGMAIRNLDADVYLGSVYCSKECQVNAQNSYERLLFGTDIPLPAELAPSAPAPTQEDRMIRKNAQAAYIGHLQQKKSAATLLVAEFVGRQVEIEIAKMTSGPDKPKASAAMSDLPVVEGGDYSLNDHMERLRYLEIVPSPEIQEEGKLLAEVLRSALPGLEQFITDERYAVLLGKMSYNGYGVCFGGGRDDKPSPTARPEDVEKSRTPYGTQRQIGVGYYPVSSYITHSCAPSARPSFRSGTNEMNLVAERAIAKGDEITVAFVEVTQRDGETAVECRKRRRQELARGWRFPCMCDRCSAELGDMGADNTDNEAKEKDGSTVDASVSRFEA